MTHDEFTKLFNYMQERFDKVDKRFEAAEKDRANIRGAITELGGQLKDYHQELLMLSHKVDRMERWIHEIAQKTGVTLSFE